MNTLKNYNFVVCWAIDQAGNGLIEFIHRFVDSVSANGWVQQQCTEWTEVSPDHGAFYVDATSTAPIRIEIAKGDRTEYRYDIVNTYAADILSDLSNVPITVPTPLWNVVVYRRGLPEFEPECEQAYALTGFEAVTKVLGRLGAGWAGYKESVVDWATIR